MSEREAGHHRDHRDEKTVTVWPCQKDARGENTKINYGLDATGEKEKRTSKKSVDGRSTSSHGNKKFRTRPMEKQRGMAFGFRKMATAVKKPDGQKIEDTEKCFVLHYSWIMLQYTWRQTEGIFT